MDMTAQTGGENAPTLLLQTQPADAQVLLDDRSLGSTPLVSWELPLGLHRLTLEKDRFACLTLRVYRTKDGTVNLGTIALARRDTLINVWRVGSPHDGGRPPARIPGELEALIAANGFRIRTRCFASTAFPGEFAKALDAGGGDGIPDVVAGNNCCPFQELHPNGAYYAGLRQATGVLTMIDPFVFLVPGSPGHAAARQVASVNRGMALPWPFYWSLDELGWNDLPGQMRSQDDRRLLENLNYKAVSAYLGDCLPEMGSLLHKDMLRPPDASYHPYDKMWSWAGDLRTVYTLGNSRLAFVLAAACCWRGQEVGCVEVLSVWVKAEDRWSLLTITYDPVSVGATREDIPRLAGALVEGEGEALRRATSLALTPGPPPPPDEVRYDVYRWIPSPSKDVVAEVAEFYYDDANRLFINPGGEVSEGELWGGGVPWRVWSVGKDGQVVTSEVVKPSATG
jgi:hypothetical protein